MTTPAENPVARAVEHVPGHVKGRWQVAGWTVKLYGVDLACRVLARVNWTTVPIPPYAYLRKVAAGVVEQDVVDANQAEAAELRRAMDSLAEQYKARQEPTVGKQADPEWLLKARRDWRQLKKDLSLTSDFQTRREIKRKVNRLEAKMRSIKQNLNIRE